MRALFIFGCSALCAAQHIGHYETEVHPKLAWALCETDGSCKSVQSEIVIDMNWRWLHKINSFQNCFAWGEWNKYECDSADNCTETCALEGATYKDTYSIIARDNSLSMGYKTQFSFSNNLNSRVFLLENEDTYQTFTLLNNEIAVDVDLSSVECGIRASMNFVAMDPDGGRSKYPTNKAGARYGTGYCDASCPQSNRFNGGRANYDGWIRSETDEYNGEGNEGACCTEFDALNLNAHSFLMSSKPCETLQYEVCEGYRCDPDKAFSPDRQLWCDKYGCEYQPYRLGNKDFYGRNKVVDTNKNFTVVTRFEEHQVTQFFIQDEKKIEVPGPATLGIADDNGISAEYCKSKAKVFDDRDRFQEVGGFEKHVEALRHPMVMALSITDDHWGHNLWLDSIWTPDNAGQPGTERGPCIPEDNDPRYTSSMWPRAKVVWSNIRFGPIGSTIKA